MHMLYTTEIIAGHVERVQSVVKIPWNSVKCISRDGILYKRRKKPELHMTFRLEKLKLVIKCVYNDDRFWLLE